MLPIPASKLQFVITRDIDAAPQAVFDTLATPAGMQGWIPYCRSAEWRHSPGRNRPGQDSVRYIILTGGLVAAERIVAWDEGREFQYTFDESSIPLGAVTTRYVAATRVEAGVTTPTRLTWSIYFDTPGWQQAVAPLIRASLRAVIALMASNVRRIAESQNH